MIRVRVAVTRIGKAGKIERLARQVHESPSRDGLRARWRVIRDRAQR